MGQHLVLTVRLHDARYHGAPVSEWPPAPARVFQALVAGVARGHALPERFTAAFQWLETLPPPIITAPRARLGNRVDYFVPNNDADAVGGDPAQVSEIRTKKLVQPRLIEGEARFEYAWPLSADDDHARTIVDAADAVYQLGRGIDMAWAVAEVVDDEALEVRLTGHPGTVHHPHGSTGSKPLACPASGSLASLIRRNGATRLRPDRDGKSARLLFSNAPKPRFVPIAYAAVRHRMVFELRDREHEARLWPWPLARAVALIERLRDCAADRLLHALPDAAEHIERALVGRKPEARTPAPIAHRVRIVPMPSIGHEHVDRAIRRIVVEVPSACPLRADDIAWAFTGLETADPETGVVDPIVLVRSADDDMLARYESSSRRWRSVTPLALPESAQRRRIEPSRRRLEPKDGTERSQEHARATAAVYTALRHAGLHATVIDAQVQREPFDARGLRAELFAPATRFPKERLWHVDLTLNEPIEGPLVLGDGRFLGLGVMTPVLDGTGIFAFDLAGPSPGDPIVLCRALRRAVMSRAQAELGSRTLGPYFSGHDEHGEPARADTSSHIAMQFDPGTRQLLILAPHVLDHRSIDGNERRHLAVLERALDGFSELRAGAMGAYSVTRVPETASSPVFGAARVWQSASPYWVNRHRRSASAGDALRADVVDECERRGLPRPTVTVLATRGVAGRGLEGRVRLEFAVAVEGPIVLGRSRYLGGGLFVRIGESTDVAS